MISPTSPVWFQHEPHGRCYEGHVRRVLDDGYLEVTVEGWGYRIGRHDTVGEPLPGLGVVSGRRPEVIHKPRKYQAK